jgi:hypothetical protein
MGDEVREEVGEYPEKSQAGNTVGGQYPGAAAFAFRGAGGLLNCGRDNRGPIFHAKTSNGEIVAQKRYASRLPGVTAGQNRPAQNFTTVLVLLNQEM